MKPLDPRLNAVRARPRRYRAQGRGGGGALCRRRADARGRCAQAPLRRAPIRRPPRSIPKRSAARRVACLRDEMPRAGAGRSFATIATSGGFRARRSVEPDRRADPQGLGAPDLRLQPSPTSSRRRSTPCSLGAQVAVTGEAEDRNARYALIAPKGAVVVQHLAPLDAFETDWVVGRRAVSRRALSLGRQDEPRPRLLRPGPGGARAPAASAAPRDSDMQAEAVGRPLPLA